MFSAHALFDDLRFLCDVSWLPWSRQLSRRCLATDSGRVLRSFSHSWIAMKHGNGKHLGDTEMGGLSWAKWGGWSMQIYEVSWSPGDSTSKWVLTCFFMDFGWLQRFEVRSISFIGAFSWCMATVLDYDYDPASNVRNLISLDMLHFYPGRWQNIILIHILYIILYTFIYINAYICILQHIIMLYIIYIYIYNIHMYVSRIWMNYSDLMMVSVGFRESSPNGLFFSGYLQMSAWCFRIELDGPLLP